MEWWMWIIIGIVVIIVILIILAWIGSNGDDEDDGFLGRTMKNISNGCGKLLNKVRGC